MGVGFCQSIRVHSPIRSTLQLTLDSGHQVKRTGQKLPAVGSRSAFMVTSKRQPMCIYGDVDENKQQAEEKN